MKRRSITPLIILGVTILMTSFSYTKNDVKSVKALSKVEVNSVEEFENALINRASEIYLNDIDFNYKLITLNYDVSITSQNKNRANVKNAYFKVNGPNTNTETISVSLSNLNFDGGFDKSNYNLNEEKSFEEIFESDRESNRFIDADFGYYSLNIDNCSISNYCAAMGPALYVENFMYEGEKHISISNSKFFNNISEYDTIHLSNNKLNLHMSNCEFYNNYAYKGQGFSIANGNSIIDKVNVHDNNFVSYDINVNNNQLCGGGVFLGGDVKMSNSYIINNKTTYGGGLGVASSFSGSKSIILENVNIKNNEATYGGAICAHSLVGQTIIFNNCEIYENKATYGASLYACVYAYFRKENNGGLIEFYFTTFALNKADDTNSYDFYLKEKTKGALGQVSLKGCISIGNDTYPSNDDDYNYIVTKEQALLDGTLTEDAIDKISEDGYSPVRNSKSDIKVPAKVYSNWSNIFKDEKSARAIGHIDVKKTNNNTRTIVLIFIIGFSLCILALLVVLLAKKDKKEKPVLETNDNEAAEETIDDRRGYLNTLSERERKVAELIIHLKKRREIAETLNYSENTIKKDLTSIYAKLHVQDKAELIAKYKDLM